MHFSEHYRIIEKIRSESKRKFGELFIAQLHDTENKVVLKILNKSTAKKLSIDRLKNEASFNFSEDGLPSIHELIEDDEHIILVRNYVDGIPVKDFWQSIKRKERLPFLVSFTLKLKPIFDLLKQYNVVHCDLKSGNILIHGTPDKFSVAIIDFGLAIKEHSPEKRSIIFPLGFAAPELLLNRLDIINQSTDIYALGILIWQLYTGELPLTHPNPSIFTNLQLTHPLPDHSALPKKLYPILAKMCNKHGFKTAPNRMEISEVDNLLRLAMSNRFQSIEELNEALKQLLKNRRFNFLPSYIFPIA